MNRSGYAQAAQDYIYALTNSGNYDIKISLLHASPDQISMTTKRLRDITGMIKREISRKSGECHQIFHCIPDTQRRIARSPNRSVGFATFETFEPPEHWVEILNSNDAVICPSKFNEKIFRHAGVIKPIFHIPHCIDTDIFNPSVESIKEHPEFTFLYFGTWKKRKGWPQLIEAFLKEFDKNDNVRLVIKTDRLTMAQRGIDEIRNSIGLKKEYAPISFETRVLTEDEIPLLIKKADCFVSPTLGEGFGIPGMQAMALGVPVVITNYSGCQDYANSETATLIEPRGFIALKEMDKIPQFNSKSWGHIVAEDVAKAMRHVICNKQDVNRKANYGSKFVADNFNYHITAKKFSKLFESF